MNLVLILIKATIPEVYLIVFQNCKIWGTIASPILQSENKTSSEEEQEEFKKLEIVAFANKSSTHEFGNPPGEVEPSYKQRLPRPQQLRCIVVKCSPMSY